MKINSLKILTLFSVLSLFTFISCQNESALALEEIPIENSEYENVDPELWPYFRRYEEEARARGVEVDLKAKGITGSIRDLEGNNIAGQCSFSNHFPNHVTIDINFWERYSDRSKEFVVFHELGHCDLLRGHREDQFINGTCVSLMRSGTLDCIDNYNSTTRERYVDELFNPGIFQ